MVVSLDDEAERRYLAEPIDPCTADSLYDRSWALTLVERALVQLERESMSADRRSFRFSKEPSPEAAPRIPT